MLLFARGYTLHAAVQSPCELSSGLDARVKSQHSADAELLPGPGKGHLGHYGLQRRGTVLFDILDTLLGQQFAGIPVTDADDGDAVVVQVALRDTAGERIRVQHRPEQADIVHTGCLDDAS